MANQIRFGVGFDIDKSSINELKSSLESLQRMSVKDIMKINNTDLDTAKAQLKEIRDASANVQDALQKAFNQKLNTYNIQTFNNEIKKTSGSLQNVHNALQSAGTQGTVAFRNLVNQLTTTNKELKQTHKLLDSMATSLGNTIKWNIASSAVNQLSGSIQQAYGYVKNLDRSLNDIRIVTGQSADAMDDFAKKANDAAKNLGKSTVDYTDAALTFYQQGLSDEEVEARANLTLKVANASGLDAATSSEYVTSVLNGYKVAAEDAEAAMDILARVGADTASGLDELAEGMSKVASTANAMGVSEEQLAATLATVISTTRQNAATVGTAFKTIYARISDIEAGTADAEVSLGNYTEAMAEMGFNVLDSTGHLRDLGEVVEEIGFGWKNMSREQQISLAQTMAGTRQYNNLIALFDNWDDYVETLEGANNATGTLQEQQDIYMESTKAHLNQLKVSAEDVYDSLLNEDAINGVSDVLAGVLSGTADWIDSIGGGVGVLKTLGSVGLMVFSQQIGKSINTTIQNFIAAKNNAEQLKNVMSSITEFKAFQGLDSGTQQLLQMKDTFYQLSQVMSPETFSAVQQEFANLTSSLNLVDTLTEDKAAMDNFLEQLSKAGTEVTTLENLNDNFDTIEESIRATQSVLGKSVKDLRNFGKSLRTALDAREFGQARTIISQTKSAIDELYNSGNLSEQAFQRAEQAMAEYESVVNSTGSTVEQEIAAFERVQAIMTGSVSGEARAFDGMADRIRNEFSGASESIVVALERAQQEARDAGITIEQALRNAARQEIISNFTKIAGAVSTLGTAVSTLKNITNIWSDEDLTTGEKVFQTITNIATVLPMVISSYTALTTGIKGITAAQRTYAAATAATTAAQAGQTAATGAATTATLGFNAALLANPIFWIVGAIMAATAAWTAYTSSVKAAEAAERARNEEAVKNAKAIRDEADAINDAYNQYRSSLRIYQETGENTDALRDSTLQLADAFGIEVNALDLLSGKYDQINKDMLEHRKVQAETALKDAQEGMDAANKLLSTQGGSTNTKDKTRRDIIFEVGFAYDDKGDKEAKAIFDKMITESGVDYTGEGSNGMHWDSTIDWRGIKEEDFHLAYETIQTTYDEMTKTLSSDLLNESELYDAMGTWLRDNTEVYDSYIQLQKDIETYATQLTEAEAALGAADFDITKIQSLDDFKKYKEQYIEQLKATLGGEENIQYDKNLYESTEDYLNHLADEYLGTIDYISEYLETANLQTGLFDKMVSGESTEEAKQQIQSFIDGLSEEDLRLIATIGIDEGATEEEVKKTLELAKIRAEETMSQQTADAINTVLESYNAEKDLTKDQQEELAAAQKLVEAYMEGQEGLYGMKTAAEEWAQVSQQGTLAQVEYLQDLTQRQNEYANHTVESLQAEAQAELELLKLKEARIQAMITERDALANSTDPLTDAEKARLEELNASLGDSGQLVDDLRDQIEELEESINDGNWELRVEMENVEDLLTVGDSILSEAEKIQQAAELIGEGFLVAAEDAEALATIFPELYENAKVNGEGIVQLDRNVVQELLGNQQAILDADANTSVSEIDNQIATLEAKKEAAEAELSMWQSVAKSELELNEQALTAMAGGQEGFTNYLIKLGVDSVEADEAVKMAMSGNFNELARVSAEVATNMDQNLYKSIQDAANGVKDNSQNMILSLFSIMKQAHETSKAIASMGDGEQSGTYAGDAQGGASGGTTFSADSVKGTFSVSDAYKASKAGQFVLNEIDSVSLDISKYTQAIAQLNALKARIRANQTSASTALQGAQSGLGGKQEEKKDTTKEQKEKQANYIEALQDEAEMFHDIDIRIQQVSQDLEKLEKVQDRLSGKELIDNLSEQLRVLQKQRDLYKEKISFVREEANAYKDIIKNHGGLFDSEGQLTNYYDLLDSALAKSNEVIERYNNLSADAQTDEEKRKVEAAKDEYKELKEIVETYESLINDTLVDLEEQIEDSLLKEIELQTEKFNIAIDVELDLTDAVKKWNNFKKNVINKDNPFASLIDAETARDEYLAYYGNYLTNGNIATNTNHIREIISEISNIENGGHSSIYSAYDSATGIWTTNTAKAYEDLQKYYEQLMSDLESAESALESMDNAYFNSIDKVSETFSKRAEVIDSFNSTIEHNIQLMELIYGSEENYSKEAYEALSLYYQRQVEIGEQRKINAAEQVHYWKELMDIALEAGDSQAYEEYKNNWLSSINELNSAIETWAQNITTQYETTVKNLLKQLNDAVSNGLGLSYTKEQLDLLNSNAENYLDTINATYTLQKLENQWKSSIDETDSIYGQRKLNELMSQQIKMLKEKGKLTQRDIERAELEYQIALRQIALAEAQQNKSSMRLRRDANGNYSYQFVSDADEIRSAQEELAAAQNELYNFDKTAYQNNLNEIYSVWEEFQQKIQAAYLEFANDPIELDNQLKLLESQYGEKINFLTEQNLSIRNQLEESAFAELAKIYDMNVEAYKEMAEENKATLMGEIVPQWNSGIQSMVNVLSGENGFQTILEDIFSKLRVEAQKYQEQMSNIKNENNNLTQNIFDSQSVLEENANSALNAAKQELNAIKDVRFEVQGLAEDYLKVKEAAIEAAEAAYHMWRTQQQTAISGGSDSNIAKSYDSSNNEKDGVLGVGDVVTYSGGTYFADSAGTVPLGSGRGGKEVMVTHIYEDENYPYPIHVESSSGINGWLKKNQLTGYDTGGYTGAWGGSAGKLALLHEKELVLNKDDTSNILSAVNTLRNIVSEIGNNAFSRMAILANGFIAPKMQNPAQQDLNIEQTVHIDASFPNVTQSHEIQDAFNNLVNIASQRAFRKQR